MQHSGAPILGTDANSLCSLFALLNCRKTRLGPTKHKPQAIPSLTGIRGVAALWVLLFHIGQGIPGYSLLPWLTGSSFVDNGFRGVDLFFILSGFIMMHVHAQDFTVLRYRALRDFVIMRCVRIYPAHLVALLLILAIVIASPAYVTWSRAWNLPLNTPAYTISSFFQTATLTTRWLVPDYGMWNRVTWSLSVELLAYLSLPVLAPLLLRVRSPALCLCLSFGSLAAMLCLLVALGSHDGGSPNRPGLLRGFGGFAAGAALCRFVAVAHVSDRQSRWISFGAVAFITLLLFVPRFAILMPFGFAILIAALAYRAGAIDSLLSSRPAMFFGKISFSLYLVHATPLLLLEWAFQTGQLPSTPLIMNAGVICCVVFVIGLSTLLHYGVERPCQRLGHNLVGTRV